MNAFFQELFQFGVYKRNQGRIVRQVTFVALVITAAMGSYRLHEMLQPRPAMLSVGLPFLLALLCSWIAYRLVNFPRFADFMIAVEAEINKVSWPTRGELIRASLVVLVTILVLAIVLFLFDYFWTYFFHVLKIFPQGSQAAT